MFVYLQKKIIIKTVLIIIISIIFSVSLINFSFSDEIKNLTDLKKLGKNLKNKIEKKESSDTKSQNCNLDKNLIYYKTNLKLYKI